MRVSQSLLLLLLLLCINKSLFSQNWEDVVASISSDVSEDISEDGLNTLEDLYNNKFNVNEVTEDELSQLVFLSDFERQSIAYFVLHSGPLLSVYELQFVLGLPLEKAKLVSLFCYAKPPSKPMSVSELIQKGEHTFASTTSLMNVNNDAYKEYYKYEGSPSKEVFRYRFQSYNDLFWGITLKKDMGESFKLKNGFDSQSMYVQLKHRGNFSNLIVGDYKVSIGQGLILSQGSSIVNSIEQSGGVQSFVLSKHSSTSEYLFSRGFGATYSKGNLQITPFVSERKLDGKIKNDTIFPFTIQKTGYHRSESEVEDKSNIRHRLIGLHSQLNMNRLHIGCAVVNHKFEKDSVSSYMTNASLFGNYFYRHFRSYGEFAVDDSFKFATIYGMQCMVSEELLTSTTVRYCQDGYTSFMSSAPSNEERGWTNFVRFSGIKGCNLYINNDLFVKPNGTTTIHVPVKGDVLRVKISKKSYSGITSYYQCSISTQTTKTDDGYKMEQGWTHKLYSSFPITNNLQLKFAVQLSKQAQGEGVLLYEDLVYKVTKSLCLSSRIALFDAPYENRLYAWEDDVMYVFSSSQYFYSGTYFYLVSKWKINKHWQFHIKISHCHYDNKYILPETYDLYNNERKIKANIMLQFAI